MEDWAEIRRLHRAEGVPVKEIQRRLDISRNTVRAALRSDAPPKYSRAATGSVADEFEPRIRLLLKDWPRMPATVVAERINWPYGIATLKDRLRVVRPDYVGVDPADRINHVPGDSIQCDLVFPEADIPVPGRSPSRGLPVLVMVAAFSRFFRAVLLPSALAVDIVAGMWFLIQQFGVVPRRLWWDRQSGIATTRGRPTDLVNAFVGTLGCGVVIAPPGDPEFKGSVERHNQYLETSFLPGRTFTGPADFQMQLDTWLSLVADQRSVRGQIGTPINVFQTQEHPRMLALPPVAPQVGFHERVRLGRDYYVRFDGNDYSVDPSMIGRLVDVHASLDHVWVTHSGLEVASHLRSWGGHATITDPTHVDIAARLRADFQNRSRKRGGANSAGTVVVERSLSDYDQLFVIGGRP